MCIGDEEVMVSFDVSSLFTNIPIHESVEVICRMLDEDTTLENRTTFS